MIMVAKRNAFGRVGDTVTAADKDAMSNLRKISTRWFINRIKHILFQNLLTFLKILFSYNFKSTQDCIFDYLYFNCYLSLSFVKGQGFYFFNHNMHFWFSIPKKEYYSDYNDKYKLNVRLLRHWHSAHLNFNFL